MGALGLGMGMGMPNLTTAVQNAVAHRELGAATGAMSFVRSLGGALGVATSGTIMSSRLASALSTGGGSVDLTALTAHGIQAMAHLAPAVAGRHQQRLPHGADRLLPAERRGDDHWPSFWSWACRN